MNIKCSILWLCLEFLRHSPHLYYLMTDIIQPVAGFIISDPTWQWICLIKVISSTWSSLAYFIDGLSALLSFESWCIVAMIILGTYFGKLHNG